MRIKTKRVRLSEGYAVVRQLTPVDSIVLSELLGEKAKDDVIYNNASVASSLVEIHEINYKDFPNEEDYLVIDETNPHNYIVDPSRPFKTIQDPNNPKKEIEVENKILHPITPNNYVTKEEAIIVTKLSPIKSYDDVLARMAKFPMNDWIVVADSSMRMNEPNPSLLGK